MDLWDKGNHEQSYLKTGIVKELVQKRDLLAKYLHSAGFKPLIPDAGYFMIADYSHLGKKLLNNLFFTYSDGSFRENKPQNGEGMDYEFCRWLCREKVLYQSL